MITQAAEVAHSLATTPEQRRGQMVNVTLNDLDETLRRLRQVAIRTQGWWALGGTFADAVTKTSCELADLGVTA